MLIADASLPLCCGTPTAWRMLLFAGLMRRLLAPDGRALTGPLVVPPAQRLPAQAHVHQQPGHVEPAGPRGVQQVSGQARSHGPAEAAHVGWCAVRNDASLLLCFAARSFTVRTEMPYLNRIIQVRDGSGWHGATWTPPQTRVVAGRPGPTARTLARMHHVIASNGGSRCTRTRPQTAPPTCSWGGSTAPAPRSRRSTPASPPGSPPS